MDYMVLLLRGNRVIRRPPAALVRWGLDCRNVRTLASTNLVSSSSWRTSAGARPHRSPRAACRRPRPGVVVIRAATGDRLPVQQWLPAIIIASSIKRDFFPSVSWLLLRPGRRKSPKREFVP